MHNIDPSTLDNNESIPALDWVMLGHHIFAPFLISYDPDGAMVYRKRDGVEGGLAFQRIEEYAWNAFNLLEQFTVRTDAVAEGGGPG
ncbi:MAG: hypothetical protein D8M52_10865, partial [Chlorobi bacterium]|nr:hypothetical protein [Chlorobiota bacterium]NOG68661.1 hypothetical protein [Chlorobiota bacterium]